MVFGCLLWSGFYSIDFIFINQDWHKIFISFIHIGVMIACVGAVLSGIEFTQNQHLLTRNIWLLLILLPLLIIITAILDPLFHTLLNDTYINTINGRIQWVQEVSLLTYFVEYGGSSLWSIFILKLVYQSAKSEMPTQRAKYYIFLFPYIVVWTVSVSHILGLRPLPGLNLTPVSLSFHVLWIFLSIGYYRMYDLIPLVRGEIVDELDEPVVIIDSRDRVVDWNIAAEHMFVGDRKYLALTSIDKFFITNPDLALKIKNLPEKRTDNKWLWDSKSPPRNWEVKAKRIRDKNRTNIGLVLVFRDITEQKLLEFKMGEANRALQIGNSTKDRFLSIISHDLRGPLTGIKTLLKILNEKITSKDKEISEMTQSLVDATESIFSLLENLLEWSKLQRGQEEFSPTNFSLSSIVNEAVNLFSLNSENKNINFILNVPTFAFVYADERMIFTVIRNLISNAIKFSHQGSKIEISVKDLGAKWSLDIKDSGVGMSESTISKLFQVGEVVKSIGTQGENGNGVGLLLSKEFIDKNEGEIMAKSDGLNGSIFSIRLPKAKSEN